MKDSLFLKIDYFFGVHDGPGPPSEAGYIQQLVGGSENGWLKCRVPCFSSWVKKYRNRERASRLQIHPQYCD